MNNQCLICYDELGNKYIKPKCKRCNIYYHYECYNEFVKKCKMNCPICRIKLKDVIENLIENLKYIFSIICDFIEYKLLAYVDTSISLFFVFILIISLFIPYLIISMFIITFYIIYYEVKYYISDSMN